MKRFLPFILILFFLLLNNLSYAQSNHTHTAQGHSCGTAYMQSILESRYPEFSIIQDEIDRDLRTKIYGPNPESRSATLYTIPVVVHVVHFTGTAVGVNENIADAVVQDGIAHLNDAFRNIGFFDPATGVDVEIEFCLASQDPNGNFTTGITRTASNAYTDLNMDTEDADLKSTIAPQWDPLSYINIWLVDEICDSGGACGTAGYAYLAGAHGSAVDGIVNEARFFGSSEDNSKVHIHEMGHYFNLSHTFEGCTNNDCTSDGDQVCDTPPDNSTTAVSCGNTTNTCATDEDDTSVNNPFRAVGLGGLGDQNDMYQNYMDYGFQSCQDRFTEGQKSRMRTALTAVRSSLLSSNGCVDPSSPEIYFSTAATSVSETGTNSNGTCVLYRDITINMDIAAAPTGDAMVSISYSGTASGSSVDYTEGVGPEITFPSGATTTQSFTIRIWDDASVEGDETIILSFSISGTTDAVGSSINQTMTVTIDDDDQTPDVAGKNMLLSETFDGGFPVGWNQILFACPCFVSDLVWTQGSNGIGSGSIYISEDGVSRADNLNDVRSLGLVTPSIDASAVTQDMFLDFDLDIGGDATNENLEIYYNANSTGWFVWQGPYFDFSGNIKLTLPVSLRGSSFQLAFIWNSNGDGTMIGDVPAMDNISVYTENQASQVETTLCSNEVYFGPNAVVYVYNGLDNDIVAKVTNLSNWDYGCTTFDIDRTGNSAQMYTNTPAQSYVTDKTLLITPSNANPSGNYLIRLYYSAAEVSGWESITGENRNTLSLFKASNAISTTSGDVELGLNPTNGAYETNDYYVEAEFTTGFSGFAAYSQSSTPLPIELIHFEGELSDHSINLKWITAEERNNDYFEIERSADGIHFSKIGQISSKGNEREKQSYLFKDNAPLKAFNYYRLRQIDINGLASYPSQIISVEYADPTVLEIIPNPIQNAAFDLIYPVNSQNETLLVQILTMDGKIIKDYSFELYNGVNRIHMNVNDLDAGLYMLRTSNNYGIQRNMKFIVPY